MAIVTGQNEWLIKKFRNLGFYGENVPLRIYGTIKKAEAGLTESTDKSGA